MPGIRDATSLGEVLNAVEDQGAAPLPGSLLDQLRSDLEAAARVLHEYAYPLDAGPVRLNKRLVETLVTCERLTLTRAHSDLPLGENLVLGTLVDKLATYRSLAGEVAEDALAFAEELLRLEAPDDHRAADQLTWLRGLGQAERERIEETLAERQSALLEPWPNLQSWHPRPEERASLVLADGDVIVSGRVDIALGGPRWGLPGVLVEVKGGMTHRSHRDDQHLYALLFAFRDWEPPAAVVTCSAADGAVVGEPVDTDMLRAASRRLAAALHTACCLAGGAAPTGCEQPGCSACAMGDKAWGRRRDE